MATGVREPKRETGRPPVRSAIYLELAGQKRRERGLTFPVGVAGLSAGGVILTTADASGKFGSLHLEGRKATIRLPQVPDGDLGQIQGRVLWTRPEEGKAGEYAVALELAEPDLRVRKVLEDRLEDYPRDIKELWDQWDLLHARQLLPSTDQAIYLVSVGAMAGGTALYFFGPETLKLYGSVLAIYGCLMMAAKSAWAMWQDRTMPGE